MVTSCQKKPESGSVQSTMHPQKRANKTINYQALCQIRYFHQFLLTRSQLKHSPRLSSCSLMDFMLLKRRNISNVSLNLKINGQLLHLMSFQIPFSPLFWVETSLYGCILSRKPKSIPTHRIQHLHISRELYF